MQAEEPEVVSSAAEAAAAEPAGPETQIDATDAADTVQQDAQQGPETDAAAAGEQEPVQQEAAQDEEPADAAGGSAAKLRKDPSVASLQDSVSVSSP